MNTLVYKIMTDFDIAELLKTSSPRTLYIIDKSGRLKQLRCPFRVVVLTDIAKLRKKQTVIVDEIKVTYEMVTVYSIEGDLYYYFYFDILAI